MSALWELSHSAGAQKFDEFVELQFHLFCRTEIWSFLAQGIYEGMLRDRPDILGMYVKD